jgi:hypothetical protein
LTEYGDKQKDEPNFAEIDKLNTVDEILRN